MIEFIKPGTKIDFVSKFGWCATFSVILVVVSLVMFFSNMRYGVDFRGGAEIQLKFQERVSLDDLRRTLKISNFEGVSVQTLGERSENEYLIKVQAEEKGLNDLTEKVHQVFKSKYSGQGVEIRKVDIVGPKAGKQLRISGFQAMGWALLMIMIYIGIRFDFKYSPGAVIALFHDVIIILGIFALSGTEFTLQTVAALLAVIGYSVNDTVIIYDRVREHEQKYAGVTLSHHINNAANETISRTILTSGTTLFISVAMYFWGGLAIKDFFLAISLGVIIGTYSSIFVAAPVTLFFDKIKNNKRPARA